jgi:VanZ family protein
MMLIKRHLFAILWALFILILTLSPGSAVPEVRIVGIDKAVHFFLFGVLMLLTLWEFLKNKKQEVPDNLFPLSFSLCIGYGIMIEFIQIYIPGRSFSVYDMMANTLGVLMGFLIFRLMKKKN